MDTQHLLPTNAFGSRLLSQDYRAHDSWLAFNRQLDRDAADLPNEKLLAQRLDGLPGVEAADRPVFWLTVARLTELALKLAGDYADACDFQAAGDLLANPRRVDVWQRGGKRPIVKARHGALSGQFAAQIGAQNPVLWLSRHTSPHIQTPALLPQLMQMLALADGLTPAYVISVDRRMRRIADAIGFLSAWQIEDGDDLLRRLETADSEDGELIAANLCRFDLDWFVAMGEDIENTIIKGAACSRFLRCPGLD